MDEKILYSEIRKRLRERRGKVSQPEVAKKMAQVLCDDKFQQQNYSRIESGKGMPTIVQLVALCRVFAVSADWLLGISDEDHSGVAPGLPSKLNELKRNADQTAEKIKSLQTAIDNLNRTI